MASTRLVMVASALAGAVTAWTGVSAQAATVSPAPPVPQCELHVWGAQPIFPPTHRLVAPAAPRGSAEADTGNPVSNINWFDPVQRWRDLTDVQLAGILPGVTVAVTRHSDAVEIGMAKRNRTRLSPSTAPCYADILLMEVYDIEGPVESRGILVDLLRAPNGMHVTYILRRFSGNGRPVEHRASFVAPMRLLRSQRESDRPAFRAAIAESTVASFSRFAAEVLR